MMMIVNTGMTCGCSARHAYGKQMCCNIVIGKPFFGVLYHGRTICCCGVHKGIYNNNTDTDI
jgi:hypothetical protein